MILNKKDTKNVALVEKIPFEMNVLMNFDGKKYCVEKNECFVKKILPEYVYKIDFLYNLSGNGKVSLLAAFLDKNGKELAKIYIENGKEFTTVKKTAAIKIEIVVTSREKISLRADGGCLIPVKPYEKREAVLAAIALSYDKPERTFEKNLNDTLEAIDKAAEAKPDIIVSSECFYGRNVEGMSTLEKKVEIDS